MIYLFVFLLFLLILRKRRYYLTYFSVKTLKVKKSFPWKGAMFLLGWIFLVLAAMNLSFSYVDVKKVELIKKFVLVNDASGSMIDTADKRGIGLRLKTLLKGNDYFLKALSKNDRVGCILFSDDALILSFLTEDPQFISQKLNAINYRTYPLAQGTRFDNAIWMALEMLIKSDNPDQDTFLLKAKMFGDGKTTEIDSFWNNKLKGDSIIIFTDGEFESLDGFPNRMSVHKLFDLTNKLGARIYVISVEKIEEIVTTYCLQTGGHTVALKSFDESILKKSYENILQGIPKEYTTSKRVEDCSLSTIFGICSLILLTIWFILKWTVSYNYAEV